MNRLMLALLVLALSVPVIAQTQDNSQQSNPSTQSDQMHQNSQMNQNSTNMQAKVSHDGKTVVGDKNNKKYKVSNPEALKNYADQDVALVVALDPDTNTIHIISVAPPQ